MIVSEEKQLEFQQFLYHHLNHRCSYTSIHTKTEIAEVSSSVRFVLAHGGKAGRLSQCFEEGRMRLLEKKAAAVQLYQEIMGVYQSFGIEAISLTLYSLADFFSSYDLDYAADQISGAAIDYQLALPINDQQQQGLDFIYEYLTAFCLENRFVTQLPKAIVQELLINYQKQLKFDYRHDLNNLYEIVFNQMVAKVFATDAEKQLTTLLLTTAERDYLFDKRKLVLHDKKLHDLLAGQPYHQKALQRFAIKLDSLRQPVDVGNFLVCEVSADEVIQLVPAMSTAAFAALLEELVAGSASPVPLLLTKLVSPYDLWELLQQGLLSEVEQQDLLQQISLPLFSGLLLQLKQQYYFPIDQLADIAAMAEEPQLSAAVARRVACLDKQQQSQLLMMLQNLCLPELDFS